jgi:hypothetical protein
VSRSAAFQQFGANDRFLVNPMIRWRGQEGPLRVDLGGSIVVPRTAEIGASFPFPLAPAGVG